MKRINSKYRRIISLLILGTISGVVYSIVEYYSKLNSEYPEEFIPLLIRALFAANTIFLSISFSSDYLERKLKNQKFIFALIVKSVSFSIIISLVLIFENAIWFIINPITEFSDITQYYIFNDMFLVNLLTIYVGILVVIAFSQFTSLHRKGDLLSFILGRFNTPREVERVFCFADLKSSTSIAEILGNLKYAEFLKEYFTDISETIQKSGAQIYQYVGDEIVLSWTFNKAIKNNQAINCVFQMKKDIQKKKKKYMKKYGFVPYFRAGMHAGKVVVTWIGGYKKEIVYIGDVLNTTARIQEDCKRLKKDFLVSGLLINKIENLERLKATYLEDTIPRGKITQVKLYSLEEI